jgi:ribosomal protein L37AE/L43A
MEENRKFSYCPDCLSAQYFEEVDGVFVCEECNKPLKNARYYGTIVTHGNRDDIPKLNEFSTRLHEQVQKFEEAR